MGKQTAQQVLYLESPHGPLRCGSCMMFLRKNQECHIHAATAFHQAAKKLELPESQLVCYLYVPGDPMDDGDAHAYVTPEQSGLGFGGTSCGSCEYGGERDRCAHPALDGFEIDTDNGCCNFWEAIEVNERAATVQRMLRTRQA